MILTLRPNSEQTKLINKLRQLFYVKTSTEAVFKAVKYAIDDRDNDKSEIFDLKNQVETLNNKIRNLKSLFNNIKETYAELSDLVNSK